MAAVTVVVTTFARPDYLRVALDSLRAQTLADFKALICDNAADERVAQMIRDMNDERLIYVPREQNLGLMRNAIEGFKAADTEFVTKLDDDDEFFPEFLEKTVEALRRFPEAVVAFGDMQYMGPEGESLPKLQAFYDEVRGYHALESGGFYRPCLPLVLNGTIALNAAVLRTDAVDWAELNDQTETSFDFHILLEAAAGNTACYYVREPLVRYRLHPGADTSQRIVRQITGRAMAVRHALDSTKVYDRGMLTRDLARVGLDFCRHLLREGRRREAWQALRPALAECWKPEVFRLAILALLPTSLSRAVAERRYRSWEEARDREDISAPPTVSAA